MNETTADLRGECEEVVVCVDGDVEGATASDFDTVLLQAVEDSTTKGSCVVVDLANVRFIDTTGMGCLVRAANNLRPQGGQLLVRGARPHVKRLFTVAGLEQVLKVA